MRSPVLVLLVVPLCMAMPKWRQKREGKVAAKTITVPATISEVLTFSSGSVNSELFSMPSNCSHGGRIYKQGENWKSGHLRYTCGKFGVYEILGCRTDKDRPMQIGETFVDNNVAHQCFKKDSAVYYRQSVCGVLGQPGCDKLTTDIITQNKASSAPSGTLDQSHGMPALHAAGLPEGWKIVDAQGNPIQLSSIRVISRTVPVVNQQTLTIAGNASGCTPFTEITLNTQQNQRRRRRQISLAGVGSAVPVDVTSSEEKRRNRGERIVGVGTGSISLDSRRPTVRIGDQKYLPGTVAGTRSDVSWSGKTEMHSGRRIAVGPGTFTFGNAPTGLFVRKSD